MAIGTAAAIAGGIGAAASAASGIAGAVGASKEARGRAASQNAFRRQLLREAPKVEGPNADELAAIRQETETADRQLQRNEQLLESVDPGLKEAGRQALALLQGQESAALAPLRRSREKQRRKLENRLRQQLGAGFETSSVAQEALTRFDIESQEAAQATQEASAARLLGAQFQGLQARQGAESLIARAGSIGADRQNLLADRRRQQQIARFNAINQAGREISGQEVRGQVLGAAAGGIGAAGQAIGSVGGLLSGSGGGGGGAALNLFGGGDSSRGVQLPASTLFDNPVA